MFIGRNSETLISKLLEAEFTIQLSNISLQHAIVNIFDSTKQA